MTTLLFIGGLGPMELGLVVLVLILLFGASKLPKLARSMGSATGEFKKGRQEVEEELEQMTGEGGIAEPDPADPDSTVDSTAEPGAERETDADRSNV